MSEGLLDSPAILGHSCAHPTGRGINKRNLTFLVLVGCFGWGVWQAPNSGCTLDHDPVFGPGTCGRNWCERPGTFCPPNQQPEVGLAPELLFCDLLVGSSRAGGRVTVSLGATCLDAVELKRRLCVSSSATERFSKAPHRPSLPSVATPESCLADQDSRDCLAWGT